MNPVSCISVITVTKNFKDEHHMSLNNFIKEYIILENEEVFESDIEKIIIQSQAIDDEELKIFDMASIILQYMKMEVISDTIIETIRSYKDYTNKLQEQQEEVETLRKEIENCEQYLTTVKIESFNPLGIDLLYTNPCFDSLNPSKIFQLLSTSKDLEQWEEILNQHGTILSKLSEGKYITDGDFFNTSIKTYKEGVCVQQGKMYFFLKAYNTFVSKQNVVIKKIPDYKNLIAESKRVTNKFDDQIRAIEKKMLQWLESNYYEKVIIESLKLLNSVLKNNKMNDTLIVEYKKRGEA